MSPRLFLQSQIIEMDRLLGMVGDHPLMAPNLRSRRAEFAAKLQALPADAPPVNTTMYFTGAPVVGSTGIDAEFAGDVLGPFSRMAKSLYAVARRAAVDLRKVKRDDLDSKLLLTALPRGSFGLELSPVEQGKPQQESVLGEVLQQASGLIRSAAEGDEAFATASADVPPRTLSALRDLLKAMKGQRADLRLVTGDQEIRLDRDVMEAAWERVRSTVSGEDTISRDGVSEGVLLTTWRFDFRADDDEFISGTLAGEVDEGQAARMSALTLKACRASLRVTTVSYRNGQTRTKYELLDLQPLDATGL